MVKKGQLFNYLINTGLVKEPLEEASKELLDYYLGENYDEEDIEPFLEDGEIIAKTDWGGSEGIYTDVYLVHGPSEEEIRQMAERVDTFSKKYDLLEYMDADVDYKAELDKCADMIRSKWDHTIEDYLLRILREEEDKTVREEATYLLLGVNRCKEVRKTSIGTLKTLNEDVASGIQMSELGSRIAWAWKIHQNEFLRALEERKQ